MDMAHVATLVSAIFGSAGTVSLFFGSFAFQPLEGSVWGSPEMIERNAGIKAKNRRRLFLQRLGLALILMSFTVQGVSAFVK